MPHACALLLSESAAISPAPTVHHKPLVLPAGAVGHGGHYHSQSPEAFFTHVPGIKVFTRERQAPDTSSVQPLPLPVHWVVPTPEPAPELPALDVSLDAGGDAQRAAGGKGWVPPGMCAGCASDVSGAVTLAALMLQCC